ncbi:MAG: hypothetical protein HDS84_03595 [Bacteroidales bacterium]|nr:hypothetical protein [Bacteroidales bacterium]
MPCLIVAASEVTVFTQTWHALHSSGKGGVFAQTWRAQHLPGNEAD